MSLLTVSGVLQGAGGGAAPAPSDAQILGVTGHVADAIGTHLTYSAAPLGAAVAGRKMFVVCPFFDGSTTESYPTSVTVGGNAATMVVSAHVVSATACGVSIWEYQDDGVLGSSADIVVSHGTARTSRSIVVVEATAGSNVLVDSASEAGMTGSIPDSTLTTTAATTLLYASICQNGSESVPPAPFTDGDYVFDEDSDEWVSVGWANTPSGSDETFGMPTDSGLRSAYVAIAIN